MTFDAEEIGLRGAYRWVETHDTSDIACVINVDGAGSSRDLKVNTNGFCSLTRVFEEVTNDFDAPLSTNDVIAPHGDQWAFVQEGVPAVMAASASESSGRGCGHTHADTLDKLNSRDLSELATLIAEATYRIAIIDVSIPHGSRGEICDRIDADYITELETGGRWPYDDE